MKIRKANIKDKQNLMKKFEHYKNDALSEKRVLCYLEHNHTIIAEEDSNIIGILQWYIKENPNSGVVEFEEVFVDEGFRGKGVGCELIEFAINDVKEFFKNINVELRKIFLFVGEDNPVARHLYEKFGFKKIAGLNNLFSDKKQELFYCLNI